MIRRAVSYLFYRFVYLRHRRLSALIRRIVGKAERAIDAQTWDVEYREGLWETLHTLQEQAHYSILCLYIRLLTRKPAILDVGCGEALLASELTGGTYARYLGIDISGAAIDRCRRLESAATQFRVAQAEQFIPDDQFDVIVFNESLYYLAEPDVTLEKYRSHLRPGGIIVVSLFRHLKADAIRSYIRRHFRLLDETLVTNGRGSWRCLAVSGERP